MADLKCSITKINNPPEYAPINNYDVVPKIYLDKQLNIISSNIPTKVSQLENDKAYITGYTETDPVYTADKPNIALKSQIPTKISQLTNDVPYLSSFTETDPVYTAQKSILALKSQIPTKVSQLTNDSGYIVTETDPVFTSVSSNFELKTDLSADINIHLGISTIGKDNFYLNQKGQWNQVKADYLPLTGGTLSGDINMNGKAITYLKTPVFNSDAANKGYIDVKCSQYLPMTGGTMSGVLDMGGQDLKNLKAPTNNADAATKEYVDTKYGNYLPLAGGTLTGYLNGTGAAFSGNVTGNGFKNTATFLCRTISGSYLSLRGGTSDTDGSKIDLLPDEVKIDVGGSTRKRLYLKNDGTATWPGGITVSQDLTARDIFATGGDIQVTTTDSGGGINTDSDTAARMLALTAGKTYTPNSRIILRNGVKNGGVDIFAVYSSDGATATTSCKMNLAPAGKMSWGNMYISTEYDSTNTRYTTKIQSTGSDKDQMYIYPANNTGCYIGFHGNNHASYPGQFSVKCNNGTTTNTLVLKPDGTATWANKNICLESAVTTWNTIGKISYCIKTA